MDESSGQPSLTALADRLHSAAIHLLRRVRAEDAATGLTASRLSALSVVVYGGPIRMGDLAAAEQVRPPTASRTVSALEDEDLVRRVPDPADRRVQMVEATPSGRRLLEEGRRRRVARLARDLEELDREALDVLTRAAELLEKIALPSAHPGHLADRERP